MLNFTCSSEFTQSNEFTNSNHFSKSDDFIPTPDDSNKKDKGLGVGPISGIVVGAVTEPAFFIIKKRKHIITIPSSALTQIAIPSSEGIFNLTYFLGK